jgi:hypothetical protein
MGCLGVHFALSQAEVDALRAIEDEQERVEYLHEVIEETYFEKYENLLAESDKSWHAMHRALADGRLTWDGGEYPLNHVVLGGEILYGEDDFIMSLKTPVQVQEIAAALQAITEAEFRCRYFAIDAADYGFPLTEEDFSYTWEWFQDVRKLYLRAAKQGRYVLFTADQ